MTSLLAPTVRPEFLRGAAGPAAEEPGEARMICGMRLALGAAALLITFLDPSLPLRLPAVTYAALGLYTLYSAALAAACWRGRSRPPVRHAHWIDLCWYTLFIGLSGGTSSVFFFFFFFSILVASFRHGFDAGLRVSVASAVLFTVVGLLTAPAGGDFEVGRSLLRPFYLLALGYMMAYWGGYEAALRRRLAFLKEVNTLSNPRFGVERTLGSVVARVREFYGADSCLLVLLPPGESDYKLWHAGREDEPPSPPRAQVVTAELAERMLRLPEGLAVLRTGRGAGWHRPWRERCASLSVGGGAGEQAPADPRVYAELAEMLEAASFITIPVSYREKPAGRFYAALRRGSFSQSELEFLLQVFGQVMPLLDNIRLLDRLASDAADQERKKIARDIHDSVIQPYIALQYMIASLRNRVAGGADVRPEIDRLLDVATAEVSGLRRYVHQLRDAGGSRDDLVSAIGRVAAKFEENYQIAVAVECEGDISVTDRLAAELFQMVHEGLSNVRKHTQVARAAIRLRGLGDSVVLEVENETADGARPDFTPRSITERAQNLGGHAQVTQSDGRTVVRVTIPL